MQALARNFLCVADEVWTLDNTDSPGAKLFKEYLRKSPGGLIFGETTKQGIYAMMPDGEFLSGHVAQHNKAQTMSLLRDALKRWNELVAKKGLKPKPIPPRSAVRTWGAEGVAATAGGDAGDKAALILQVCVRDLPFKGDRYPGPAQYQKWVNQTWLDFTKDEVQMLLPKGGGKSALPDAFVRRIGQTALIDFVRGQTSPWPDGAVRKAALTVEATAAKEGSVTLRYQGEFQAVDGARGVDCRLHGKAVFDTKANRFRTFELVAAGMRHGTTEQFRGQEPPSPLGWAFIIEDQYAKPAASETSKAPEERGVAAKPAPAERKPVPPASLAAWDAKLRAAVQADLAAKRRTTFAFKTLGQPAEISSLEDAGALKLRSAGSEFPFAWSDLTIEDKRAIAAARLREGKTPADACLAAFYHLACGDAKSADAILKGVPAADADAVRAAIP